MWTLYPPKSGLILPQIVEISPPDVEISPPLPLFRNYTNSIIELGARGAKRHRMGKFAQFTMACNQIEYVRLYPIIEFNKVQHYNPRY